MPTNYTSLIYRSLSQQRLNFIGPKYRQMIFASGVVAPVLLDLEPGAEEIREGIYSEFGGADIVADTMDIPLVGVGMTEDSYPIFMIASAYDFTFKSSRSLSFANKLEQITRRKTALASRAIEERCHRFMAVGSARVGQEGFLNNSNVPVRTVAGFDPTDPALTATELRSFFIDLVWFVYTQQVGHTMLPTRILISPGLFKRAIDLIMPDSQISVLASVRNAIATGLVGGGEAINLEIVQAPECSATYLEANGVNPAGTDTDRIVVYTYDSEIVSSHAEPLGVIPPDWMGTERGRKVFANFKCITPVIWSQPTFGQYIDIPASV